MREEGRERKLAVEKSSLQMRRVDGRRQPGGNVCKGRKNVKLLREGIAHCTKIVISEVKTSLFSGVVRAK